MARIHGAIPKNDLPVYRSEVRTRVATPEEIDALCGPRKPGERISAIVKVNTRKKLERQLPAKTDEPKRATEVKMTGLSPRDMTASMIRRRVDEGQTMHEIMLAYGYQSSSWFRQRVKDLGVGYLLDDGCFTRSGRRRKTVNQERGAQ